MQSSTPNNELEKVKGSNVEQYPVKDPNTQKEERELKVGDIDKLGFKLIRINNTDPDVQFYMYEYRNNGTIYNVEHVFYKGTDEGWKFSQYADLGTENEVGQNSRYIKGTFKTQEEMASVVWEDIENNKIAEVAELLKNEKISQVVFHSQESEDPGEDMGLTIKPDQDARLANYIFNNLNKKSPEEIYGEGATSSFIAKSGTEKNLSIKEKGIRLFIDAGGKWLGIEKGGKLITNIYIDHHGSGRRPPTSSAEMMLKIMEKADILKEKPAWIEKFIKTVTEMDNLSYIEEVEKKEKKGFDKKYFLEKWPNTIYAIAEKMPFETLLALFEKDLITDPSKDFTKKELEGELGKIKVPTTIKWLLGAKGKVPVGAMEGLVQAGKIESVKHQFTKEERYGALGNEKIEITIAELCKAQKHRANEAILGVEKAEGRMKKRKFKFENTALGKILYHDHFVKEWYPDGNPNKNKIHNDMAYLATRASGFDTLISLNKKEEDPKKGKFFINSKISLRKVASKFGLTDVRGNFIFGKTTNKEGEEMVGEKELLNTIDPKILEKAVDLPEPPKPKGKDSEPGKTNLETEEEKQLELALEKKEELKRKIEAKRKEIENLISEKNTKIAGVEKKYERRSSNDMSGFDEIPEPEEEILPVADTTNTTLENQDEEPDVIGDDIWNDFINNNNAPESVLISIGEKIKNNIKLSPRELAIEHWKKEEIEKLLNKTEASWENKKAEIKKRRAESWVDIYGDSPTKYFGYYNTGKEDEHGGIEREMIIGNSEKEVLEKINAKYDAELAALEKASKKD